MLHLLMFCGVFQRWLSSIACNRIKNLTYVFWVAKIGVVKFEVMDLFAFKFIKRYPKNLHFLHSDSYIVTPVSSDTVTETAVKRYLLLGT